MKLRSLILLLAACALLSARAAYNFKSGEKYYISCDYSPSGYVALGANHGSACELYYVTSGSVADDGYWYIQKNGDGYTFENAQTGDFLAYTDTYSSTCKYLTLTSSITDNERWTFTHLSSGSANVQSVGNSAYYFNLRTSGTWLMGCYAGTGSANCQFRFYTQSGVEVEWSEEGSDETLWDSSQHYLLKNINDFGYIVYNPELSTTAPVLAGFSNSTRACANDAYRNEVSESDPNAQWIIRSDGEGGYSFYNVGCSKYLSITPTDDDLYYYKYYTQKASIFSDTPYYYIPTERKSDVYAFSLGSDYQYPYLCAAPQQAAGSAVTHWSDINDEGSQFELIAVATDVVQVSGIELGSTALKIPVGSSYELPFTIAPFDATYQTLSWSSSDRNVATVTGNRITAVSAGTTVITATSRDAGRVSAVCQVTVYEPGAESVEPGEAIYVYQANGRMDAFPTRFISSRETDAAGNLTITTTAGDTYSYKSYEVLSVSDEAPKELPEFSSYKFNNKYNDQLASDVEQPIVEDADGTLRIPQTMNLLVQSCIGKRLTASFNFTTDDAAAYVKGEEQVSKQSRISFENDVVYTVAPRYYKIYTATSGGGDVVDVSDPANPKVLVSGGGGYTMQPYGRQYTVHIDWGTDNTTAEYNVPIVYITLDDGAVLTDINKNDYLTATISIDGGGAYPDFPETAVQIKGRGNSSWGGQSWYTKNPYRLKFASKLKPFNLTKGKSWVLLANKQSGSMTTNAIAMKIADMVQTVGCNHIVPCELYINGDYRGSYNFTEKVGFSNNSVDLADESNAFLLELDSYYDESYKFRDTSYNLYVNLKEPDLTEETDKNVVNNKFKAIQDHFNYFTGELLSQHTANYLKMLDVDAFVRAMLVTDLTRNQELKHPKSWFLYNESGLVPDGAGNFSLNYESPYVFGPVWDFDWAYGYDGTGRYFINSAETDILSGMSSSNLGGPFFRELLRGSDVVAKAYYALWKDFMESGKLDELLDFCQEYYDFVHPSLEHNADQWTDGTGYATQTANAISWLRKRAEYIYKNLTPYDLSDLEAEKILIGDVNGDGAITTADVVCALNYILGLPNEEFNFKQADTDGNDLVTMKDVAALIDLVMQQGASTRRLRLPAADAALRLSAFNAVEGQTTAMPVSLYVEEGDYSGLQFDVKLPEGCLLTGVELPAALTGFAARLNQLDDGSYRVVLYSSAQNTLPTGFSTISLQVLTDLAPAESDCVALVTSATLATSMAEDHRLASAAVKFAVGGQTTDIQSIGISEAVRHSVYDLQGRRVERPASGGIYIIDGRKTIVR